jgi:hypothetical protein
MCRGARQAAFSNQLALGIAIPLNWNQLRRKARVIWILAMRCVWTQKEDKSLDTGAGTCP